jgi:2-dehydro-3-deoxy-D-arabinonate dehydratase
MRLAKVRTPDGQVNAVRLEGNQAIVLSTNQHSDELLTQFLHADDPVKAISQSENSESRFHLDELEWLAPIDRQEVWAAGVTYRRSKVAREEESVGAAQFYDKVYTANRPELFLKSTAERVIAPRKRIRVRKDSRWNVPEPELALVFRPDLRIVGYTIGNDVSSRDIEGENPLYLPQAKVYRGSCSIGPAIVLAEAMPSLASVTIRLQIIRANELIFDGSTTFDQMIRSTEELVQWVGKEYDFPYGGVLLTGTGIVPPDSFSLTSGDSVQITIDNIGTLSNIVE